MNITQFSPRQKLLIFGAVTVASILGCAVLNALTVNSFYPTLALVAITILAPLATGLFVYTGKPATFFVTLAIITVIIGLLIAIPGTIAHYQFSQMCESKGSTYQIIVDDGYMTCAGLTEGDYVDAAPFAGPLTGLVFWLTVLSLLVNLANILYVPLRLIWTLVRRPIA